MRPRAFCLIRQEPHYRRDAFVTGLRACGLDVTVGSVARNIGPQDVVVVWNRYGIAESAALQGERVGAAVIIAENGYIGAVEDAYRKPYASPDMRPETQLYALALNHHNGAGRWWIGEPGRWRAQGVRVSPWRTTGEHVLILPQRGIGPVGVAMPKDWPQKALERLRTMTRRPVRIRSHPGNAPAERPLKADLDGAWCVMTWGSGGGIKALVAGVPVCCDWPKWIGYHAAAPIWRIETPICDDAARDRMLDCLAWAQHEVREISTGEPLHRLIELHRAKALAA